MFDVLMICLLPHHRTIQADEFTAKLFGIYRQVRQEGQTQVRHLIYNVNDVDNLAKTKLFFFKAVFSAYKAFPYLSVAPSLKKHVLKSSLRKKRKIAGKQVGVKLKTKIII